ncbi:MAG: class II fumarate hydratase [Alphaproteobacteria bacterium]|nr:class II fumarate hydratase [Alphaproteobacteria bacterium]
MTDSTSPGAADAATRTETDSLGTIEIPAAHWWGPQTERARRLFRIGTERLPTVLVHAQGLQKQAAAMANKELGVLAAEIADPIIAAAGEIAHGALDAEFPLPVWQTGSGTQTNMNANEVIANRANAALGRPRGSRSPVHPNDHVNRSQSSNDSFPTVMHIAAALAVRDQLLPGLATLQAALSARAAEWAGTVKIGRTHMMDAVPVTLGQEFAAYARQIELGIARVEACLPRLYAVPQGGTAAGTGLNAPAGFDAAFVRALRALTHIPFTANPNKFEGMGAHDAFIELHGALNVLAASLMKIGNDIRILGSGPRCGFGELVVPSDGLTSSIMPGKTNPTQVEALTMVAAQVMGNHVTVTVAGSQGHLELNVYKPVIIYAVLQSARLLGDAAASFAANMITRLQPDLRRIDELVKRSLMLVTALNPHVGYDKAVAIARTAHSEGLSLRDAAIALGYVTGEDFDRLVDPAAMLAPGVVSPGGGGS